MKSKYLNFYNNLIRLTTNKSLYKGVSNKQDSFGDRLTFFLVHFAFILKQFKNENNDILQELGESPGNNDNDLNADMYRRSMDQSQVPPQKQQVSFANETDKIALAPSLDLFGVLSKFIIFESIRD